MKRILFTSAVFIVFISSISAQCYTLHLQKYSYRDEFPKVSYKIVEVLSVSLSDMVLCHNILTRLQHDHDPQKVSYNQFYKIKDYEKISMKIKSEDNVKVEGYKISYQNAYLNKKNETFTLEFYHEPKSSEVILKHYDSKVIYTGIIEQCIPFNMK